MMTAMHIIFWSSVFNDRQHRSQCGRQLSVFLLCAEKREAQGTGDLSGWWALAIIIALGVACLGAYQGVGAFRSSRQNSYLGAYPGDYGISNLYRPWSCINYYDSIPCPIKNACKNRVRDTSY